ncbi:hypothetical protein RDV84_10450 [Lysobacter yananisis]|uniref:DUF4412 domain-containing protein n=1 Tax=Lysobacter yananisis TaxID=1003114 RepID=A0ABY9PDT9_9GAMM|nr:MULTISPECIES: hypothetical protein [Lysobacter]QCW27950.1 hypothetical protein FE772_22180 [Lysobacter enzymogenes]UZW61363.1 hypothetical protein BV903_003425 [Lysobacter enzymogenes]WMT05238.1 hypothetical protein RDV84_10450 [Lysobacter yananisis]
MIKTSLSATLVPAAVLLGLAAAHPAVAGPKEEVVAAVDKFLAAKSYHASMSMGPGAATETDFVAPDRMRVRLGAVGDQVLIGDTMYVTVQGKTRKQPAPGGGVAGTRSREKVLGNLQTLKVAALGSETLAGTATRKYKVENSQPNKTSSTFWVAADTGYPVQAVNVAEVGGKTYTSTLKYSRYNDPSIRIEAPAVK